MKTYYMGRFAVDVPTEMKFEVQHHEFRLMEIKEYAVPVGQNPTAFAEHKWQERLAEIRGLKKPAGINKIIIREEAFPKTAEWARGILYYSDYLADDECNWDILIRYGDHLTLFQLKGLLDSQEKMLAWMMDVIRAYHPRNTNVSISNTFHTELGSINLPYKRQESTYARFEGHPLNLKLEVDMSETHEVEEESLAERLAAAIATRFVPGVDVDTIRSGKRDAAGLKGEELITRMSADGEETQLDFTWEYQGEAESGERPEIQINMEAPDGSLDEKLKIWDVILDSFKPMYKTKR